MADPVHPPTKTPEPSREPKLIQHPHTGVVCLACGSTEIREQHAKIFCVKCNALLENCCGD